MERLQLIRNQIVSTDVFTKIETEILSGNIGIIYLNAPKELNALTITMRQEISQALRLFDSNDAIKVVILASKVPKAFCAGANIKEFQTLTTKSMLENDVFKELSDTLEGFKKPLIGAINGVALGGGCEIALKCDVLIAANNAKFGLPELKLGLVPGIGGTQRLTQLIGRGRAAKMMYTGEAITAAKALEYGLVTDLYEPLELLNKAKELAQTIAQQSRTALKAAKECIGASENLPLHEGNARERKIFSYLLDEKSAKEGVSAFINKRKPDFNDC